MSCEVSDKSKNGSSKADHLNTRIPYGIRPVVKVRSYTLIVFQSTHPVWDATSSSTARPDASAHFNPRIPYGMRPGWLTLSMLLLLNFNPRIPYGMRRLRYCDAIALWEFQSTHPVWDATTIQTEGMTNARISIHASRMGCDVTGRLFLLTNYYFNPRIPYGMRRRLC